MTETIAPPPAWRRRRGPRSWRSAREGVPSIEGHFDEAIAAVGVLEQIRPAVSRAWTGT
jgi:allantoin racemase